MNSKRHKKQLPSTKYFKKTEDDICEKEDKVKVFSLQQDEFQNCIDLTRLPYLEDHIVLKSVTTRYEANKIYTWAGPILVATNPNKHLPGFYEDEVVQRIHKETKEGKEPHEPHIYTVAGLAYNRLLFELGCVNQAILVSGESGAGKTESARFLLKYLTKIETDVIKYKHETECNEINPVFICNRILASNPILEAFGNAATLRNHNSSRFGKLIKLHYAGSQLMGAELDTFLLEKTRVTHQPSNERNFHIFYQLVAGHEKGLLPELNLGDTYFCIIPSSKKTCTRQNDLEGFHKTMRAFQELGFTQEQRMQLLELLLAILHLGNVAFKENKDKEVAVLNQNEACQLSMRCASSLLGLRMEDLVEAFTVRKISVTTAQKETVFTTPCETTQQCEANRDALMQLLYTAAFSHLVTVINRKLTVQSSQWLNYIAILDVYGFETYDENSLEQLCINYANERLQQEFVHRYLSSEQKVLVEEGFVDIPKTVTDNSKCVSALDSAISVFAILNEQCQLKRPMDERTTCARVCTALASTGFIFPLKSPIHNSGFSVKHFAGLVNYSSNGILLKNKDQIPDEVVGLLEKSKNNFVSEIIFEVKETGDAKNRPKNRKVTTLLKFKGSLDSLMKTLNDCDLHYIRCIKPNSHGSPGAPDKRLLLNQLRSNGILDTVKISQAGYSMRMLYKDFVHRYCSNDAFSSDDQCTNKEKTLTTALKALGDGVNGHPNETKCRFGRTRIFLSEESLRKLEDVRSRKRNNAATSIQNYYKRYRIQLKYETKKLAVRTIQNGVRTWLTRRKYKAISAAIRCLQRNAKMIQYRSKFLRMRNAAITLQKHIRLWLRRSKVDSVCPSRLSMTSADYSNMASVQFTDSLVSVHLTDFSVSDIESVPTANDRLISFRRMTETEESGIETDTESLSGQKSGKTKTRIRRDPQRHTGVYSVTDSGIGSQAAGNAQRTQKTATSLAQNSCQLSVVLKYFTPHKISNVTKISRRTDILELHLFKKNQYVFYRDGVLSRHGLSKESKIKFHTKLTCLPYSTWPHLHDLPQGIPDAF